MKARQLTLEQFNDLKVVVTGGAGFMGSHLVSKLLDLGSRVTVVDNFLHGNKLEQAENSRRLTLCQGDIRDYDFMRSALAGQDLVFHLAAVVGVEYTQMSPLEVLDVGIQGTANVLKAAAAHNIKRAVVASSSEVYGDSPVVMDEEQPMSPKSTYAITKLAGEAYCEAFYQSHGLEYTCLRYFNVYGPRQDERFIIPSFVNRVLSDEPIIIYGDGRQTRGFTFIDDAVIMTLLAAQNPETKCQEINIGTGDMITINELADLIVKIIDARYTAKPEHVNYDRKRPQAVEVFNRRAGVARARRLLQYTPGTTLVSGIKKYLDWRGQK